MSARTSAVLGAISNFVVIVAIGASLGWLSGLSSSPLLSVTMPVLLTLIASALAAVRLIRKPAADTPATVSIYAIAVFSFGLAGGATLGTMARLGDWFAPDPVHAIERWTRWRDVVPHDEVVRRVFERTLPDPYRANRPPADDAP
jgi:hypothetical protein